MLQTILSYLIGLGPYFAIALALGISIPILLLVTHPLRWLLASAILFLCLVPFGGGELGGSSEGSLFRQVGWGSVFLLALFQALRENGRFEIPWGWIPIPYLLLLLYALASVAWSEVPLVSARRAVQLIGVLFIALALIRISKADNPIKNFIWPGFIFLVLGVAALAMPSLSIDPDGNYKGLTFTKNVWGQFALLMALIFMFQALSTVKPRLYWWLFAFASLSLMATRSATSILLFVAAITIVVSWAVARRNGKSLATAALSVSMLCLLSIFAYFVIEGQFPIAVAFETGMVSIGKDPTLTGRTALWHWMSYEIASHPWFGAGYGGFWMGLDGPSHNIVRFFTWRPGQAHSGYIDVVNELGYAGMALLSIVLLRHLWNILAVYHQGEHLTAVFHFAILVVAALLNVSESNYLRTTHLWWIVLSTTIIHSHVLARTNLSRNVA